MDPRTVGKLLRGAEMEAIIGRSVRAIAEAGGPGMEASVVQGRTRVRGSVITATQGAREAEARSRALTRAIDAGRQ